MLERIANGDSVLLAGTAGKSMVVVASTGGHLSQAARWCERFGWEEDSLFITFENEQSVSLLADRPHVFVPYVAPRAVGAGLRAMAQLQALDLRGYHAMVSTGAGVAVAALPHAVRNGLPFLYLESMSRFAGPSLTGRVLSRVPGVHLFSQYDGYPGRRWTTIAPLLSDYTAVTGPVAPNRSLRVFVTLGTIAPYRFDRIVDAVRAQLRPGDEVVWQLGVTDRGDLPGRALDYLRGDEFEDLVQWADVIVTHAGIGTLLGALDAGKLPVTMARLAAHGEHVDDHQTQALHRLVTLGLAVDLADHPTDALRLAAGGTVMRP